MAGTWTYDPALLSSSDLNQTRYTIGDTDTNDQLLYDEEIQFTIDNTPDLLTAAYECVRNIIASLSKDADQKTGEIATWLTKRIDNYKILQDELEKKAKMLGAQPYVTSTTVSGKAAQDDDTDRSQPAFRIDEMDNPNA